MYAKDMNITSLKQLFLSKLLLSLLFYKVTTTTLMSHLFSTYNSFLAYRPKVLEVS